jgi:hypothetical protein
LFKKKKNTLVLGLVKDHKLPKVLLEREPIIIDSC